MSPAGCRRFSSSHGVVPGTSSQYTLASRTRRAMSWLYCEPKSRTRTVWRPRSLFASGRGCVAVAGAFSSGLPHADVLGLLEGLALRRDRRGDHHLDVLELRDLTRAAHAERRTQRAGEVLRAIVHARGPEQDLPERRPRADVHSRAAWQVRIGGRHAPVEALRRRFLGAGERGADHDRVGAGCEGLAHVGADAHAAVGDHSHAHASTAHVLVASRGNVGRRRDLRHSPARAGTLETAHTTPASFIRLMRSAMSFGLTGSR